MNKSNAINPLTGMPPTNNQKKGLSSWRNFFPINNLLGKSEDPQLKRGITRNLGHRSLQAPSKPVRRVIMNNRDNDSNVLNMPNASNASNASNAFNPATKLAFRKSARKSTRKSARKSQRKSRRR